MNFVAFARNRRVVWAAAIATLVLILLWASGDARPVPKTRGHLVNEGYYWRVAPTSFPVNKTRPLPTSKTAALPKVQATFYSEIEEVRQAREERQQAVKDVFLRSWQSSKAEAWMSDELRPVSGGPSNPFGGWAASLVDALDTLWIMDLRDEFDEAVIHRLLHLLLRHLLPGHLLALEHVNAIDFTYTDLDEINIFETTIRHLGGFLSAFDLSGNPRLLIKAIQVGDMVYKAFDTPNHMPVLRWNHRAAYWGWRQAASDTTLLVEIGSLSLELTRLSQLTGDAKWFDAADRITDLLAAQQDSTKIPGLWPLVVNAQDGVFDYGSTFTLGAMADSVYEYLPKMAALSPAQLPAFRTMYEKAVAAASKHLFFRPVTPENADILVSGLAIVESGSVKLDNQGQHLVCFAGGMLALGSKIFSRPEDMELANRLTDGCVYAYNAFPLGIMPETMYMDPCARGKTCEWNEERWKEAVKQQADVDDNRDADTIIREDNLPAGFTRIPDCRYHLRPEAIESVFILYRTTARKDLPDSVWSMFQAIDKTELANSAILDVTDTGGMPARTDSMESFWMGVTLKYFYLMFSDPELVSLDDYVFNTKAHPFRRQ